ncbi:MAG: ankyrin repeat domain-containing protein [Proteobacteria bacterium]|nr:ankyrin repeat domain-containing protein [Pseudomonadota bacterium]
MLGEDLSKKFRTFANAGKLEALKKISCAAFIKSKGTPSGKTALHYAASQGHLAVVEFLVSEGAPLNEPDSEQNNPLMLALMAGHKAVAQLLLPKTQLICTNKANLTVLQIAKQHPVLKRDAQFINYLKSLIFQQAAENYQTVGEVHITESGVIHTHVELEKALGELNLKESPETVVPVHPVFTSFEFAHPAILKELLVKDIAEATPLIEFVKKIMPQAKFDFIYRFLNTQVDKYFESKDPKSNVNPQDRIDINSLWETTLSGVLMILVGADAVRKTVESNNAMSCFVSKLYMFNVVACYDKLVQCLQNPNPSAHELTDIKELFDKMKMHHYYAHYFYGAADLHAEYMELRKALILLMNRLHERFDNLWLGFNELQFHIDRKNKQSEQEQSDYHAKLIYSPAPTSIKEIDAHCMEALVTEVVKIARGEAKRTQFIVDPNGQTHALALDVSWNPNTGQLEMICVESSILIAQYNFILELSTRLMARGIRHQILAIQGDLQKDMSSCYTFAYIFSRMLSKLTFAQLNNKSKIPQPSFSLGQGPIACPLLRENVQWLDVTALGERAVKMGHSYTDMRKNLLKIYPHQEKEVDQKIAQWKSCYEVESLTGYTTYRRQSLRLKAIGKPLDGITMEKIYAHTKTTTPGHALRRLAAGWGPLREMRYLLNAHAEVINELGTKEGKTPLDWANQNKQMHRAKILKEAGALTASEKKLSAN